MFGIVTIMMGQSNHNSNINNDSLNNNTNTNTNWLFHIGSPISPLEVFLFAASISAIDPVCVSKTLFQCLCLSACACVSVSYSFR